MARNRKRAKERRDRRPQRVAARARLAAARVQDIEGAPSPLEHAAPDVELADAQIALGAEAADGEFGPEAEPVPAGPGGDGGGGVEIGAGFDGGDGGEPPSGGGEVAVPEPGPVRGARPTPLARMIAFLEGSWRELQRVQWPDRRQVVQATAVVIGFVVVAGVFLGVADTVASHFMNAVITGGNAVWVWVGAGVIGLSVALWVFTARDR